GVDRETESKGHGVAVKLLHSSATGIDSDFEVVSAETQVVGANPFGRVSSGAVVVKGKAMVPVRIKETGTGGWQYILEFEENLLTGSYNERNREGFLVADLEIREMRTGKKVRREEI